MSSVRQQIKNLRTDFSAMPLDVKKVSSNPIRQFEKWMQQALDAKLDEPNAMTLSTVDRSGQPDARIVLLRDVSEKGFSFFTNYHSKKGKDISFRKKVCLNFYWPEMARQVRILGTVTKLPGRDSNAYFHSRPRESQLGAWASHQSERLQSRDLLMQRLKKLEKQYEGKAVPRPPHWGGYLVKPHIIEFWQGRQSRLHDRLVYQKNKKSGWDIVLLNP